MSKSRDKAEIAAIITENKNLMQTITQLTEENREQVNISLSAFISYSGIIISFLTNETFFCKSSKVL
jgi:hypothetical protein